MANEFKIKHGLVVSGDTAVTGGLTIAGNSALHTGNISSYAVTSLTDTLDSITSRGSSTSNSVTVGSLDIDAGSGTARIDLTTTAGFGRYFNLQTNGQHAIIDAQDSLKLRADGGDTEIYLNPSGQDYISFTTESTERMRIANTGNLLINTTTDAGYKLDVNGTLRTTGGITTDSGIVGPGAFNIYSQYTNRGRIDLWSSNASATTPQIQLLTDGAIRMSVTKEGNVGIGTASPTSPLHVVSSTNKTLLLDYTAGSGTYTWVSFKQSGTEQFRIFGDYSANYLSFYNDQVSSHQLTLASNGNLGIGTTSPDHSLQIERSTGDHLKLSRSGVGSFELGVVSSNALKFSDGGTERMRIDSSGNVGIGTTTPAYKLDVVGDIRTNQYLYLGADTSIYRDGANILRTDDAFHANGNIHVGSTGHIYNRANTNSYIKFTSPDISMMGGSVGIGTLTPSHGLTVTQDPGNGRIARLGNLEITTQDATYTGSSIVVTGSNSYIKYVSTLGHKFVTRVQGGGNTLEALTILPDSGNVGINVATPTTRLHIQGDTPILQIRETSGNAEAGISINHAVSGNHYNWFIGTLDGNARKLTIGATVTDGHNTVTAQAAASLFTVDQSTSSVGIGTTSPTTKLDVNGVITATGGNSTEWNTAYSWGDHSQAGYLTGEAQTLDGVTSLGNTTTNSITVGDITFNNLKSPFSPFGNLMSVQSNGGGRLYFNNTNAWGLNGFSFGGIDANFGNGNTITFHTNTTERMRINPTTGNVGIGTSTDAGYKLDVAGTARITGSLNAESEVRLWSSDTTPKRISAYWTSGIPYGLRIEDFAGSISSVGNGYGIRLGNVYSISHTFGTYDLVNVVSNNFNPTSGSGNLNFLRINGTVNQTGTAYGTVRGLFINPTLTAAADFRAIETTAGNVIFNGGNVGIGTSSPSQKLHLVGGNARLEGNIYFGDANHYLYTDNATYAMLSSNRNLQLARNGTAALTVASTLNVLIGTTTDSGYKLDVNGSFRAVGSGTGVRLGHNVEVDNGLTANALYVRSGVNQNAGLYPYNSATGGIQFQSDALAPIIRGAFNYDTDIFPVRNDTNNIGDVVIHGGGSERVRFKADGKVGIGTTAPTEKLHVDGNVKIGGGSTLATKLYIVGTGNRGMYIQANADGNGSAGADFRLANFTGGGFRFDANVSPYQYFQQSLGSSSTPWAGVYAQIFKGRDNPAEGTTYLSSGTSSNPLILQMGGTEYVRLAATTGNVLIGTTTDSGYKLNVNGTQFISESLQIADNTKTGDLLVIGVDTSNNTGSRGIKINSYDNPYVRLSGHGNWSDWHIVGGVNQPLKFIDKGSNRRGTLQVGDATYPAGKITWFNFGNVLSGGTNPAYDAGVIGITSTGTNYHGYWYIKSAYGVGIYRTFNFFNTGILEAETGFSVPGGTSSQFLKADGSVDSSTYLTSASLSGYATQTYVNNAVSALVDSAPGTLDTLNELAAALGDDPNFATTVATSIGTKWTQDNTKISNWDTAYSWGNHASAGYMITRTSTAYTTIASTGWDYPLGVGTMSTALSSGLPSGATYGYWYVLGRRDVSGGFAGIYINSYQDAGKGVWIGRNDTNGSAPTWEKVWTDGDFTSTNISNWNTAYGWGNHSSAGYLTSETYSTASQLLTAIKTVDGSGSGLDADLLDGISSGSFLRSDAADSASGDITFNGAVVFSGTTSETSNKGTYFSEGNYVQFAHQPMSRMWGNECLWVDRWGTVTYSGSITNASNVFRTGDNYASFVSSTGTDNPVSWTIETSFSSTTNVSARRAVVFAHGGFSCDLIIEVKNVSNVWETIYSGPYSFSGSRWHYFDLLPEITYPTDWSIHGLRFTIDNYGAGSTRYIGQLGITNTKDSNTFPYISQGGGYLYDNSILSFGTAADLQIYHDGSNSYIDEVGSGNLFIRANAQLVAQKYTGETLFKGIADGAVELYHDNVKKLETTSTGITITGEIVTTGGNSTNWNTAYSWGNHAGLYDNYGSWNLKTNGTQRTTVQSGGTLDIVAGTNVSVSYGAGGVVTINSTDTNTTYTAGTGLTLSGTQFSVTSGTYAAASHTHSATDITSGTLASARLSGTYSIDISGKSATSDTMLREDNRNISPSELSAGYMKFGFTSWTNNNSGPWADFLHLRSYTDASGGSDNLVMFKKSGIGMRIYQQAWGSTTAYSTYEDVWTTGSFTSTNVSNWNTAYGWGNHASAGYLTSVTAHTHSASDITSGTLSGDRLTWNSNDGFTGTYSIVWRATNDLYTASWLQVRGSDDALLTRNIIADGTITATGGNSTNWNTAYSWGNHASAGYLTSSSLSGYATQTYVNNAVSALVDSAPGTLDTLNELAAALGDDPNFATTVTNSIATKLPLAGGTMTGDLTLSYAYPRINLYDTNHNSDYSIINNDGSFSIYDITNNSHRLQINSSGNLTLVGTITASGYNNSNWDTAYGWGNHAVQGYATTTQLADYLPLTGGTIAGALTISGNLVVNGTITENSSIKIKENVEDLNGSLEKVVNLRPVSYNKIGQTEKELGLIAEEVQTVYPEFVQFDENGEPVGVNYSRLTVALIGAVQELTKQVEELKNKING